MRNTEIGRRATYRITKFLTFAMLFIAMLFLLGFLVKALWNWLMPPLFGLKLITYWQALALMLLGKLLFSGFRAGGGRGGYRRWRMRDRWEQMTPEEREKFRQGFRDRWGCAPPPDLKPGA